MSHTLISFLGRAKLDPETGYRTTPYDFDGIKKITPFFGMALCERLQPEKLLLIGTAGSMWDVFFVDQSEEHEQQISDLMDAVKEQSVDETMLCPFIPKLKKQLGCDVECLIIDFARDEKAQVKILLDIAQHLNHGEHISIDITHAFRHLPMLILVASRYLETIKDITTDSIYYGAYGMDGEDKPAPVIKLEGLLKMLEWIDALSCYDKDGDYHPFAELFENEGLESAASSLKAAAFFERTNQITSAYQPLREFHKQRPESNISKLITPELLERTKWANNNQYAQQQIEMAEHYLGKGDYLRCCIFAQESLISHQVQLNGEDPLSRPSRKFVREQINKLAYSEKIEVSSPEWANSYREVNNIRNALAHGTRPDSSNVAEIISSDKSLSNSLSKNIDTLKNIINSNNYIFTN